MASQQLFTSLAPLAARSSCIVRIPATTAARRSVNSYAILTARSSSVRVPAFAHRSLNTSAIRSAEGDTGGVRSGGAAQG